MMTVRGSVSGATCPFSNRTGKCVNARIRIDEDNAFDGVFDWDYIYETFVKDHPVKKNSKQSRNGKPETMTDSLPDPSDFTETAELVEEG